MQEIWKDVVGFEDRFQVSNLGNMYSKKNKKQLVQGISKTGYKVLSTKIGGRNGIYKCFKVHRLVAQAFILNPENKPFVNHIDGNKLNNSVDNLEWVTGSENTLHAVKTNLIDYTRIRSLTEEDVNFIREHYKPRDKLYSGRKLAKMFNVSKNVISDVITNRTYNNS